MRGEVLPLCSLALGWLRRNAAVSFNRNSASVRLLFRNRNRDFQYAIMEVRFRLVHLGSLRQRNASIKEPILTLRPLHSAFFLFLFEPALSLDHERIVLHIYLHVLGLKPRQFSMDVVLAVLLRDLDGRRPSGAATAFALQAYFLEHAVHLLGHPSQKRERISPEEFLRRDPERIFSAALQQTGSGSA